jgi:hypothetical protein
MYKNLAQAVLKVVRLFYPKKGPAMKKLVLASAISALFAAPAVTFAQAAPAAPAAPAVPTLSQVLDASGVSVSGYIDVATSHANRNLETAFSDRVFDSQNNSLALHQFGLTVAKQPKEGFGGVVNLTVGRDAQQIHSFPEVTSTTNPTTTSMFDVTQAYFQYATGPLTVMAGKFTTLQGTEVIASPSNTTFSRSILFGSVPFTHTGIRGIWAVSDAFSLTVGVNNGWDQLTNDNRSMTLELGATWTPIKPLTIAISDYNGKETIPMGTQLVAGVPEGSRNSGNLVVTYNPIDPLTLGFEYLNVTQENFPGPTGSFKAKYSGEALYVTYMFSPKWRGVLRYESFDDKDGLRFGAPNAFTGDKYKEGTITVSYLAADSFELRGEVRRDTANNQVFTDNSGGMSKSLLTYAIQGIYKF